jgi:hypothetical protein
MGIMVNGMIMAKKYDRAVKLSPSLGRSPVEAEKAWGREVR